MASSMISPFYFFQILFLLPFAIHFSHAFHSPPSNASDQHALLAFKSEITFDPFQSLESWTSNVSFCKWRGVQCSQRRQRVVCLNLSNLALEGTISPLLGNLSFLRTLNLSNNILDGHIPYQLGRLSRLRMIDLRINRLGGSIPSTLSACRSLEVIILMQNHLSGNIPSELGLLPNLYRIRFRENNLTGTIPISLGNISSLSYLSLASNKLHGRIPWELGRLNQLNVLGMGFNHLTGEIPTVFSNCTMLRYLDLAANHLSGEIPQDLCSQNAGIRELFLFENRLSGKIPTTLYNCTQLQILELGHNLLTGTIPSEIGKLSQLTLLHLGGNQFVSSSTTSLTILNVLTNCSVMEFLALEGNNLSGALPSSVGELSPKLYWLDFSDNKIRGKLPSHIGNLTNLDVLYFYSNLLTGEIPSTLSMLHRLEGLYLYGNNFKGKIPTAIGQLKSLAVLRLDQNKLSENIPDSLCHLQNLRQLYLNHNQLTGNIPPSLGKCFRLELLDLSHNRLNGYIPPQVAGLSNAAFYFNLSNNLLQGPLPLGLSKMDKVQAIDVSANLLTGPIPYVIENCIALAYLNVSFNKLEGHIPDSFGRLLNLMDLDLAFNNLSGKIPMSLAILKVLEHINFSTNKLSGEVPKDGVFKKLGLASFTGNVGLCGPWVKLPACFATTHKYVTHAKRVVIPIVVTTIFVIWCLCMGFLWRRYCNRHILLEVALNLGCQRISFSELGAATNNFDQCNLLGVGSFGKVYKGFLQDGTMVAIKVLDLQNEDVAQCFDRECNVLRRVRHRNLVRVITSYSDLNFKALVFPLMQNGSLDKLLYPEGTKSVQGQVCILDLIQRLSIAIDIAQGIEYLHHHCFVQVIHCDLKPTNVLLGEDMIAYVADFGISRLILGNSMDSYSSIHALKGSIGYIAPEYGMGGDISTKGDVYSYGIVLLEMVTRKKPTNNMFEAGMNLSKWASRSFPNTIEEVVDSHLLNNATHNKEDKEYNYLRQLINLGLLCTKESPEGRPNMISIVKILHSIKSTFLGVPSTPPLQSDMSYLLSTTNVVGRNDDSQTSSSF